MRFLADENFPRPSVHQLRRNGHDVASVAEVSPGLSDHDVLAWADHEQRFILTFDRDFGKILYGHHTPPPQYPQLAGVIYLHFIPASPIEAAIAIQFMIDSQDPPFQGMYVVIGRTRTRTRPLP